MLIVRGAMAAFPTLLAGTVGTLIVLVLTAVGIYYHYRQNKPQASPPAAPAPKS
jgi:hypothetical protein